MANYADSGEMAGGFYDSRFWKPAKALIRAGDYVFIEFGHNDQGDVTASQFSTNMLRYVTDAQGREGDAYSLYPGCPQECDRRRSRLCRLDEATRSLAVKEKVALFDLTNMTLAYYKTLPDKSVVFATATEGTHLAKAARPKSPSW